MTGETKNGATIAEGRPSPWTEPCTGPVLFEERIEPKRSLSKNGFFRVMLAAGTASTLIGTYLWLIGAWPVIGFGGLDVLLLYLAFRASYSHARLFEHVRLTADEIGVERIWPDGRRQDWRLEPHWTKVEVEASDGEVLRLRLACRGQVVTLGSFLSAAERTALAERMAEALGRRRLPNS